MRQLKNDVHTLSGRIVLCFLCLAMIMPAHPAAASYSPTAEARLLEDLLAMGGRKWSSRDQLTAAIQETVAAYQADPASAQPNAEDRFAEALTEMGLMDERYNGEMKGALLALVRRLEAENGRPLTRGEVRKIMQDELIGPFAHIPAPTGSQLSRCALATLLVAGIGAATILSVALSESRSALSIGLVSGAVAFTVWQARRQACR